MDWKIPTKKILHIHTLIVVQEDEFIAFGNSNTRRYFFWTRLASLDTFFILKDVMGALLLLVAPPKGRGRF